MTAQLQQISQMLRDNPEQLQMIKQTLAAEHPEVAQVKQNKMFFSHLSSPCSL